MPLPDDAGERARRLLEIVKNARGAVVLTHDNPDPDCIGAAVGIQALGRHHADRTVAIAYGGVVGRAENRALVERLGIGVVPVARLPWEQFDCVALVDTQPDVKNHSLPPGKPVSVVIDHHPIFRRSAAAVPLYDVRRGFGATTTMVVQYLRALDTPLDPKVATALFYGIASDTRNLNRMTYPADVEAYLYLFPLVDLQALADITRPRVPRSYFSLYKGAIEKAEVRRDVVLSWLGPVPIPDTVGEIADFLVRLEGCVWSVAGGAFERHLYVSLRTNDPGNDAGRLVKEAVGKDGSAGGHGPMAGARIALSGEEPAAAEAAWKRLAAKLLKALGRAAEPGIPLAG